MNKTKGQSLRIIFMGTPDFAVYSLDRLVASGYNITAVITTPDKPAGRGQKLKPSPVKTAAQKHGLKMLQPANLKDPEFLDQLKSLEPDLFIVVAFRIMPKILWSMPSRGTVNLHASLLPDYRGAAPINRAIINGEKKSGVTTFFIDDNIDTGKIIFQDETTITDNMNAGELHDILMQKGAELIVRTIDSIAEDNNPAIEQVKIAENGDNLHKAPKINKDDCRINWNNDMDTLHNFIRGLSPYPGAWTELNNDHNKLPLKVFRSEREPADHNHQQGKIITDHKKSIKVCVPGGFMRLKEIQLAGKKRMDVQDFLRGYKLNDNALLE